MSPETRVAVIVNANARAFAGNSSSTQGGRLTRYDELVRIGQGRAHFFLTRTRSELASALERAHRDGTDTIIFCGGDGTYGAGITAIRSTWGPTPWPSVGFGPGGTVGTVPRALGIDRGGSLVRRFARVLHEACTRRPALLMTPTLEVRLQRTASVQSGESRVAFLVGAGLVSSFFSLYDPNSTRSGTSEPEFRPSGGRGRWSAAWITGRVFVESFVGGAYARSVLEPVPCEVEVDGRRLPWSASSLLLASVVRDVGLGLRVAYRAAEDARRPHVVVSGLLPRQLGPRLPRVLKGTSIADADEPRHYDANTGELILRYAAPGGPLVVDGDLEQVQQATITAGPMLRVLAPG